MKVLWFSGNPALYANSALYNGGGWIASLQSAIHEKNNDLELAIAFPWESDFKDDTLKDTYYGVKQFRHSYWKPKEKELTYLERMRSIIDDFKPDIIMVFGTEERFGIVQTITDVPVIIHIQGILAPIHDAYMPQGLSWMKFYLMNFRNFIFHKNMRLFIEREKRSFETCKYFIGRTDWDKRITRVLSPNANYFYCSEMLRPVIYNSQKVWSLHNHSKAKILTVISPSIFKGGDIILRTAKILHACGFDFEWCVYGITSFKDWEGLTGIYAKDLPVMAKGVISADGLVDEICSCDVFVHPSYIENSSNTVCEAQCIGAPVIAHNVGGITSLINSGVDGVMVAANDTYSLAAEIMRLFKDKDSATLLGANARLAARKRHNPETIVNDLIEIYKTVAK